MSWSLMFLYQPKAIGGFINRHTSFRREDARPIGGGGRPPVRDVYTVFSESGRMPPDLSRFLADAALQKVEPYKAFDNVYYVGICWVSSWLITSPRDMC